MAVLPFIGAFLEAMGTIIEKKSLKNRNLNYKNYTVFSFLAISLISLPFILFFWRVENEAFQRGNIITFIGVVFFAIIANLCIFYSLKKKKIGDFEPLWMMQPFFVIFLAIIFYSSERNIGVIIPAAIASIALVVSHLKRHHLDFDKYLIAGLFGSLFFAIELTISKSIIDYYSPFTFYFLRCFGILIISYLIFRPSFSKLDRTSGLLISIVGITWILYRAIIYYGYSNYGVIYTTLIFTLSPVLMLIFARIYLKEKMSWRQIISNSIIIGCVAVAVLQGTN